jgi:hypothetical protein
LFAFDRPFADVVGFILSFHGVIFVAGFVAPALAVTALLGDRPNRATTDTPFENSFFAKFRA